MRSMHKIVGQNAHVAAGMFWTNNTNERRVISTTAKQAGCSHNSKREDACTTLLHW